MELGNSLQSNAPPLSAVEANVAVAVATPEAEWHSVPLEGSLRSETEYCFLLSEGKQATKPSRMVDLSMCGLSKLIGGNADDESNVPASTIDCKYISIKASKDSSGVKEVRVSIHGLEDPKKSSENVMYKTGSQMMNDSGPILGHGDDGCLPLLQQVRAFIKGVKLSCAGLLSGDGKPFLCNGWSSLLQRSFSFKSSPSSTSESESLCKKGNSPALSRSASGPTPTSSICDIGIPDALKASPLQARDPASRAEALPLAHYRPTDGAIWKEGDVKTVQSSTASKPPVNCKKPPRYPGRTTSLDSATLAAQRAAKKCRDRASAKRKSRLVSAAASTGLTPLVALVLTIGFGLLMIFQGVFVQTSVSYGRNVTDVDVAANSRPTLFARKIASYDNFHPIDPHLPASLSIDVSNSEAIMKGALQHSMTNLPWSRSLLTSQKGST